MSFNKYKIEQIAVGDKIYFDDVYTNNQLTQSNFDEYWKVVAKEGGNLLVNLRDKYNCTVDIKDVRHHLPQLQ